MLDEELKCASDFIIRGEATEAINMMSQKLDLKLSILGIVFGARGKE
jgi:hypothetical protein